MFCPWVCFMPILNLYFHLVMCLLRMKYEHYNITLTKSLILWISPSSFFHDIIWKCEITRWYQRHILLFMWHPEFRIHNCSSWSFYFSLDRLDMSVALVVLNGVVPPLLTILLLSAISILHFSHLVIAILPRIFEHSNIRQWFILFWLSSLSHLTYFTGPSWT